VNRDNYLINDLVFARFTNSGNVYRFMGRIVGKTKNYWKVEALESPYANDAPNRVFHIATLGSRTYSANNCIVRLVGDGQSIK